MNVGRLEEARARKGLSKGAIAKLAGASASQMTRWLRGQAPRGDHLLRLALGLEVGWAWLLGLEDDPNYQRVLQAEISSAIGAEAARVVEELVSLPEGARNRAVGRLIEIVAQEREREIARPPPRSSSAPVIDMAVASGLFPSGGFAKRSDADRGTTTPSPQPPGAGLDLSGQARHRPLEAPPPRAPRSRDRR